MGAGRLTVYNERDNSNERTVVSAPVRACALRGSGEGGYPDVPKECDHTCEDSGRVDRGKADLRRGESSRGRTARQGLLLIELGTKHTPGSLSSSQIQWQVASGPGQLTLDGPGAGGPLSIWGLRVPAGGATLVQLFVVGKECEPSVAKYFFFLKRGQKSGF